MKRVEEMGKKEIREVLFKHYQWPPSCMPKDIDQLRKVLKDCRKRHPQIKTEEV